MSRQTDNAYPKPLVMPKRNRSGALRLLIVGILLTVAAIVYFVFRDQLGDGFALVLMGILSMVGVFYLFGAATGLIQFSQKNGEQDLAHSFMDSQPEGTVISDARGQIVYANQAYAMMTGVANAEGVRSLDNVLTAEPAASDAIYRLTNAVRDGLSAQEEVRLSGGLSREGHGSLAPVWYRIKARPIEAGQEFKSPLVAWQIADISDERAEQERFFQELQEAINHLDHAPAGFFSADPSGRIIYLNATLAEWLGVDLTQFTPGSLTLNDIVAGSGMALIKAVKAEPGTSRNTVIDLDLIKRNGQSLAVRFYHRVQAARDGTRGTSRTIVLDRAEGEDSSMALRSAEVRFTRFFNSAPMAIAAVDSGGHILRTNARFLDIFAPVVDRDAIDGNAKLEIVVHERDRETFNRALAAAFAGQASISPVDTVLPGNEERHIRFYMSPVTDLGGIRRRTRWRCAT